MKFVLIKAALLFWMFIICFISYAQTDKPHFEHISLAGVLLNVAQQGSEDRYNVDCMLQDSMGYLWFGTWDGLNKFDGYNFTTFKHAPQDDSSITQNTIFTIWEDSNKIIWIGTAEGGISKYDRYTGRFTQYKPPPDPASFVPALRAVSAVNEDREGTMWIGNFLGELRRFNKQTGKFYPQTYYLSDALTFVNNTYTHETIYSKGHDAVNCIYKDHEGTLWIGSNAGLHKLVLVKGAAKDSVRFINFLHDSSNTKSISSNSVTCVFEDHNNKLWIGTDGGGLNLYDKDQNVFNHYLHNPENPNSLSSNAIARGDIAEDKSGNLWIGTFNGLNRLNPKRTQFARFFNNPNDPTSLSNNFIESLMIDRSGILWVGSHWQGVDKFDPYKKPFTLYAHSSDNNSISNNLVTAINEDKKGRIWIGTAGGGLNAFDKRTGRFTSLRHNLNDPNSLDNDIVNAVLKDNEGNMWIRCQDNLSKFNTETGHFIHYSRDSATFRDLQKEHLTAVYFDRENCLWLGTHSGIKRLNLETNKITYYRYNPQDTTSLSDNAVYVFFEDKNGFIWIGHGSVGLSRLNVATGKFSHYLPNGKDTSSLSTSIVNSIFQDTKGNLWFGTLGGGLCRFNEKEQAFTTFTIKQGLADNTIVSMLEDDEGNLWLATGKGLSRFMPGTQTFTNYNSNDGLQGNVFSEACYKDGNGTLYFGGLQGLNAFNPRQIRPNNYIPPVVITEFKLFDKLIPGKNEVKKIVLEYDKNFFSFQFAALNFSNSANNQYAYQLEGVDKDWVHSGTRREASYTDIVPGDYVFKVKASNNDGLWNNEGIAVHITIKPPWWRSAWAYFVYALIFVSILLLMYRMQRQRLINKEREHARELQLERITKELELEKLEQQNKETEFKKRLADLTLSALRSQINPHFIFNCLNSIKLYATQNNIGAASDYLTKFSRLIRQVLENSRSEKISLTSELEVVRLSIEMEVMRFKEKLKYNISIGKNVDTDFIEIPPLLLQPYVENAIWHGLMPKEQGGTVEINADIKGESTLMITVKDDGVGRAKAGEMRNKTAGLHKSFGMKITSERINLMNQMYNTVSNIHIDDLVDDIGKPAGTLVTIQIDI